MRVLVTADLHLESSGPEPIRRLVAGMDRERPDLVVLGGDLGNPVGCWDECLTCFLKLDCPIAVLPGNHDFWFGGGNKSEDLYRRILPQRTRSMGFHWLEDAPMRLAGGVAIVGSVAWYDYSARAPYLKQTDEYIIKNKSKWAADAFRIDWPWDDFEFSDMCRARLRRQLEELQADESVREILVVTHVPLFEEQLERRPEDENWDAGTAFFGNLTIGGDVREFSKVRYVISGHTHNGMSDTVERDGMLPIEALVVPSDYLRPRWITVDFDQ